MGNESITVIFGDAISVVLLLLAVLMLPGLVVGLLVSIFQAATQINESSLSFVPKIFVTFLVLIYAGPWMLKILVSYTHTVISNIPYWLG